VAGTTIPLISRRTYNFDNGSATIVVAKAVNVVQWTSGLLVVRVHSASIGTSSSVKVSLFKTAPSAEDPATDFEDTSSAVASAGPSAGAGAGELETAALSSGFGGFLQVSVVGTLSTASCIAEISAELVLKD
jgi:hypothetical protein